MFGSISRAFFRASDGLALSSTSDDCWYVLEVTIKRRQGHDKGVSIDVLLRHLGQVFGNTLPKGVTIVENKSKTLLGSGNTGHIVLRAAADAPEIDDVPISVLAHVSINFVVKVSYSSAAILVSVKK